MLFCYTWTVSCIDREPATFRVLDPHRRERRESTLLRAEGEAAVEPRDAGAAGGGSDPALRRRAPPEGHGLPVGDGGERLHRRTPPRLPQDEELPRLLEPGRAEAREQ